MRYSLSGSLLFVGLIALSLAALFHASLAWGQSLFATILAILSLAVFRAIYYRGDRQSFWIGVALAGWGYLILAFGPGFAENLAPLLPSAAFAEFAYPRLSILVPADSVHAPHGTPVGDIRGGVTYFLVPFRQHFEWIVHLIGTILASWIGGLASVSVQRCVRGAQRSADQ